MNFFCPFFTAGGGKKSTFFLPLEAKKYPLFTAGGDVFTPHGEPCHLMNDTMRLTLIGLRQQGGGNPPSPVPGKHPKKLLPPAVKGDFFASGGKR